MSAAAQVAARLLDLLQQDAELRRRVHGIYDRPTARAAAPLIEIGAVTASDWGTKDRAGSELRIELRHVSAARDDGAVAARINAAAGSLRGVAAGWEIVSARVMRSRSAHDRQGRWEEVFELRARCLSSS